jgi:tRNA(Ile)-lysidine synthase
VARLDPAVAAVREAVRHALVDAPGPSGVLVACSGGADSLALAAQVHFVASRLGRRTGLATVDHQLQPGSAERARTVAAWAEKLGYDPVRVLAVRVEGRPGGPEAAARQARYEALTEYARADGFGEIYLGHTQDDQAETVLLAMVRGAGLRGLAGMPARRDVGGVTLVRPLLGVSRARVRAACLALGLHPWDDPHNSAPEYARTRARALLRSFADSLGSAVVANLARTAELAAADAELLDALAAQAGSEAVVGPGGLSVRALVSLPAALRTRVLHDWAVGLGAPGAALSHRHVRALEALVIDWHGQGPVYLPGAIVVTRTGDMITSNGPGLR